GSGHFPPREVLDGRQHVDVHSPIRRNQANNLLLTPPPLDHFHIARRFQQFFANHERITLAGKKALKANLGQAWRLYRVDLSETDDPIRSSLPRNLNLNFRRVDRKTKALRSVINGKINAVIRHLDTTLPSLPINLKYI